MLYDLNVGWTATQRPQDLQRTISFLAELGYNTIALNHNISTPLPSKIVNPIPTAQPFTLPEGTTLLRRCTLLFADPSQNYRLSELAKAYDVLALRPTTEKAYLAACTSLSENSIISLDLTQRFPFHFRPKQIMTAINRGIRIEICYAAATMGDTTARRNVINNVLSILRATSGRGLIVSSQAGNVLGVRGPADVTNLLVVWGLNREKALESISTNPRAVVVNEGIKRTGFRGAIDIIQGGEKDEEAILTEEINKDPKTNGTQNTKANKGKRKAEDKESVTEGTPAISKRQAKKQRLEALKASKDNSSLMNESPNISVTSHGSNPSSTDTPKAHG